LERMRKRKYSKRTVKLKYTEANPPFHPADVDPCLSMAKEQLHRLYGRRWRHDRMTLPVFTNVKSCNPVHECRRFVSTDPTTLQVVKSQKTVATVRDYHSKVVEFSNILVCHSVSSCAGIAQSVQWLATGWTVRGSKSRWRRYFPHPSTPALGPTLYNGHRVFPGGKAAGVWRWPPNSI
jgi:hypothetical protein